MQNLSADSSDLEASRDMLGLQAFLDIERSRPNVTNAQHIQNKLIYDSVNEVPLGPPALSHPLFDRCKLSWDSRQMCFHIRQATTLVMHARTQ